MRPLALPARPRAAARSRAASINLRDHRLAVLWAAPRPFTYTALCRGVTCAASGTGGSGSGGRGSRPDGPSASTDGGSVADGSKPAVGSSNGASPAAAGKGGKGGKAKGGKLAEGSGSEGSHDAEGGSKPEASLNVCSGSNAVEDGTSSSSNGAAAGSSAAAGSERDGEGGGDAEAGSSDADDASTPAPSSAAAFDGSADASSSSDADSSSKPEAAPSPAAFADAGADAGCDPPAPTDDDWSSEGDDAEGSGSAGEGSGAASGSGAATNGGSGASGSGGSPEPVGPPRFDDRFDAENFEKLKKSGMGMRYYRLRSERKLLSLIKVLELCGVEWMADSVRRHFEWLYPGVELPEKKERDEAWAAALGRPEMEALPTWARRSPDDDGGSAGGTAGQAGGGAKRVVSNAVANSLRAQGMEVHLPALVEEGEERAAFEWGVLAGYDAVKRQIEDAIILPLAHPEVFEELAKGTKAEGVHGTVRPRAVLFEGPPGTGKTTCARVIAQAGCVPLVVIQFESILSKWYGEDERKLGDVLKRCEDFEGGAVIFIDELDSAVTSRDGHMHECTRRLLGVLLKYLDGFDPNKKTVFIAATNRKEDLDPALRSRFSTCIRFDLPDEASRAAIMSKYAKQLSEGELQALARATPGMAGRDLKSVCEQAERRWASEIIRGKREKGTLPSLLAYLASAAIRQAEMRAERGGGFGEDDEDGRPSRKLPSF